jgi:hypothetical protein
MELKHHPLSLRGEGGALASGEGKQSWQTPTSTLSGTFSSRETEQLLTA